MHRLLMWNIIINAYNLFSEAHTRTHVCMCTIDLWVYIRTHTWARAAPPNLISQVLSKARVRTLLWSWCLRTPALQGGHCPGGGQSSVPGYGDVPVPAVAESHPNICLHWDSVCLESNSRIHSWAQHCSTHSGFSARVAGTRANITDTLVTGSDMPSSMKPGPLCRRTRTPSTNLCNLVFLNTRYFSHHFLNT